MNKKQRTDTVNEAKKIKIDNFTRSNREKFQYCYRNIDKMKNWMAPLLILIISHFDVTNNIFADCIFLANDFTNSYVLL